MKFMKFQNIHSFSCLRNFYFLIKTDELTDDFYSRVTPITFVELLFVESSVVPTHNMTIVDCRLRNFVIIFYFKTTTPTFLRYKMFARRKVLFIICFILRKVNSPENKNKTIDFRH